MGLGALALASMASGSVLKRWEYPDCEADNCYRNFIDDRFSHLAPEFCFGWLDGTTTEIREEFGVSSSPQLAMSLAAPLRGMSGYTPRRLLI
jgi:hypothetical protein